MVTYFEAAAVIVSLTLLGQCCNCKARSETSRHPRPARTGAEYRAAHARGRQREGWR